MWKGVYYISQQSVIECSTAELGKNWYLCQFINKRKKDSDNFIAMSSKQNKLSKLYSYLVGRL